MEINLKRFVSMTKFTVCLVVNISRTKRGHARITFCKKLKICVIFGKYVTFGELLETYFCKEGGYEGRTLGENN